VVIPESQGIHVKKEDVVLTVVSLIPNGVSALKVGRVLFEVFGKLTKCGCIVLFVVRQGSIICIKVFETIVVLT
jgi:hypothetical protein